MMKAALLFVASTGVLIYFIAPVSEEKAAPVAEEAVQKPQPVRQETDEDDEWGDDDYDDDGEEEFVFGEPMTTDDDYEEDEDEINMGGEVSDAEQAVAEGPIEYAKQPAQQRVDPRSPKPGKLGSASNPIVLKTSKPVNTNEDD
jgi:hypothetical protein